MFYCINRVTLSCILINIRKVILVVKTMKGISHDSHIDLRSLRSLLNPDEPLIPDSGRKVGEAYSDIKRHLGQADELVLF